MTELEKEIYELYVEQKLSILKVSKAIHKDKTMISNIVKKNGWMKKDIEHAFDKEEMQKMRKAGMSIDAIAEKTGESYGRTYRYIRNILESNTPKKTKNKKRVSISVGDRILYKERKQKENPQHEQRTSVLEVVESNNRRITCRHEKGFTETFEKFDVISLFNSGHMKLA